MYACIYVCVKPVGTYSRWDWPFASAGVLAAKLTGSLLVSPAHPGMLCGCWDVTSGPPSPSCEFPRDDAHYKYTPIFFLFFFWFFLSPRRRKEKKMPQAFLHLSNTRGGKLLWIWLLLWLWFFFFWFALPLLAIIIPTRARLPAPQEDSLSSSGGESARAFHLAASHSDASLRQEGTRINNPAPPFDSAL